MRCSPSRICASCSRPALSGPPRRGAGHRRRAGGQDWAEPALAEAGDLGVSGGAGRGGALMRFAAVFAEFLRTAPAAVAPAAAVGTWTRVYAYAATLEQQGRI